MSYGLIVSWMDSHPALASWVQAAGSIFALLLVISVAWWQGHQSRKLFRDQVCHQAEEARLQRVSSLKSTVEVAEIVANRVIKTARKMPDIILAGSASHEMDAIESAALWISRLPIYELPGALVARDVQNIGLCAKRMLRVLEAVAAQGVHSDDSYKLVCGVSKNVEKALESLTYFADGYTGGVEVIRAADL